MNHCDYDEMLLSQNEDESVETTIYVLELLYSLTLHPRVIDRFLQEQDYYYLYSRSNNNNFNVNNNEDVDDNGVHNNDNTSTLSKSNNNNNNSTSLRLVQKSQKAHLLLLFSPLCDCCITHCDERVRVLTRSILKTISRDLGLETMSMGFMTSMS